MPRSPSTLQLRPPFLGAFALSLLAACGGSAPPPAAPAPATPPKPPATLAAPAPDLTEVPEPNDLVALVRWKNPDASVATVVGWAGLHASLKDAVADLLPDPRFAGVVATSAPVDAAVALDPSAPDTDPQPFAAVSIGLRSLDEAKKAAESRGSVSEVRPGVYRVVERRHHRHGKVSCVIAASVGEAPARLVCGDRDRDVDALAPYLTRTLPKAQLAPSDLHGEVRFVPVEKRYGQLLRQSLKLGADFVPGQLQIGQPTFDRALTDAVQGLVEEITSLTTDLDTLTFDVGLDPSVAKGSLALKFRDRQSWTVGTLLDSGNRAAAAPPSFWRLPADSSFASFGRGADPKRFAAIRHSLSTLLDGWLAHEGVAPADRQAMTELLSDKYGVDAPSVAATGPLNAAERASLLDAKGGGHPTQMTRQALASFGWEVLGIEEPSEKWSGAVKNLAAAYNRPGVQKMLKKELSGLELDTALPSVKVVTAPKGLPAGSVELDMAFVPDAIEAAGAADFDAHGRRKAKAKVAGPAVHVYFEMMPDAGRTWFAFGGQRDALVSHLIAVKAGAPDSGTIAGRAGLEPLKNGAFASAGFTTVGALLRSFGSGASRTMLELGGGPSVDFERLLNGIPHHGETPILIEYGIQASGQGATLSSSLEVPKGSIEDAVAAAIQIATGKATVAASPNAPPPPPKPALKTPPGPKPPPVGKQKTH